MFLFILTHYEYICTICKKFTLNIEKDRIEILPLQSAAQAKLMKLKQYESMKLQIAEKTASDISSGSDLRESTTKCTSLLEERLEHKDEPLGCRAASYHSDAHYRASEL